VVGATPCDVGFKLSYYSGSADFIPGHNHTTTISDAVSGFWSVDLNATLRAPVGSSAYMSSCQRITYQYGTTTITDLATAIITDFNTTINQEINPRFYMNPANATNVVTLGQFTLETLGGTE